MNVQRIPNSNTNHHHQACAACKYQRRKCQQDCTLAPYFPPTNQQQFLNAHKLFGVSNIVKSLKNLNTQFEKDEAMKTMIFEADARANDPVGGCYRIVCDLQWKLAFAKSELDLVNNQVAILKNQAQMQMNEKKLGLMVMENPVAFVGGGGGWVGENGEPPPPPQIITPSAGVNDEGSCSLSQLEQNPQAFMGMFDEQLDALESIECRVKSEEGEDPEVEVLAVDTKPNETIQEDDSKGVASLPPL